LLEVGERVRQTIAESRGVSAIREAARSCGMRTLIEEGNRLVADGATSEDEVRRVGLGTE
jgi:type II secretory ATPase GspE/PulE/Tfp pilus assembly ATPase PilB-like protein